MTWRFLTQVSCVWLDQTDHNFISCLLLLLWIMLVLTGRYSWVLPKQLPALAHPPSGSRILRQKAEVSALLAGTTSI